MSCLSMEVLSAVVDGEASPHEMEHARTCASCRVKAQRLRELDEALRRLPMAAEGPSPVLRATLRGLVARRRRPLAWIGRVAAGAVAMLLVASSLLISPQTGTLSEALAEQAISSHVRAFTTGNATGCEVESEEPSYLAAWLGSQLGRAIDVPTPLAGTLVGARSCRLFGEQVPAVVYRTEEAPVTVFLPQPGTEAFVACQQAMGSCIEGRDGQTVCVLPDADGDPMVIVGALAANQLLTVVRS